MSLWISNGRIIDSISVDDRSAQFGDGLFETIAIRSGEPRFWRLHMARLQIGCERLGIEPPAVAALRADVDAAMDALPDATSFATVKIIVSAGDSRRGYRRQTDSHASTRVGIFAARALPAKHYQRGVEVRVCSSRLAVQPQLAGVKSLNRLEQVLARSEWNDESVFEGLMLDTDDRLICGTMSNVFIATSNSVITPAITRCGVAGIMRQLVITLLEDAGISCTVRDFGTDELFSADEVFLTNSQFGILPVRRCRDCVWSVGPIARKAMDLAAAGGVAECAL